MDVDLGEQQVSGSAPSLFGKTVWSSSLRPTHSRAAGSIRPQGAPIQGWTHRATV